MLLLEKFHELLQPWRSAFPQQRTWQRAQRLAYGLLTCLRTHLTSNAICATGRQFLDWSADYRLFSRSPWAPHALFDPIFDHLAELLPSPQAPVVAALDDTLCKKTGRHIPGATYARDPLSPAFHLNLCRGLRFVQASVLVRATQFLGPARALPVRFEPAPPAVKPKNQNAQKGHEPSRNRASKHARKNQRNQKKEPTKTAAKRRRDKATPLTPEEQEYRLQKKLRALTQVGVRVLQSLRQALDARPDTRPRQLLVSGDGSYTNRTVLRQLPERTTFIGRIRKDAKLFQALPPATATRSGGRPRRYGAVAPTPEQVLHEDAAPVVRVRCFAAGEVREIPVKILRHVFWRKAGPDLPLLLVVIKPLGYRLRKGSKLLYRQPAFLICTDPELDLPILLQAYIDRWEIECNHRDEKSFIGVAQGQVWNPQAVVRLPQFQVAIYSLLMLASILAYGFRRTVAYLPLPLWRRKSIRPSILDLLNLLRDQIFARLLQDNPTPSIDDFAALAPVDANAAKLPLASETLCTMAV
jgi:DDE superfamily endonuclease